MLKARKLLVSALLVCCVFSSAAWARNPLDALSARTESSIYMTMQVKDLGGLFREVLSPGNIETIVPFMKPDEAQAFRLFASMAGQLPVQSVALASGMSKDGVPFLQLAAVMPERLKAKMDLVAAGKATPEDLVTILLGDGGLLLAAALQPTVQQGKDGPYYSFEGVSLTARDDLLVMTLSPKDLEDSLGALADAKNRLNLQRKFKSESFYAFHIDPQALVALAAMQPQTKGSDVDVEVLKKFIKAPLKFEMAFEAKPGSYLVSAWFNVLESIPLAEESRKLFEASPKADMFLVGEGDLLFGFNNASYFKFDQFNIYPEFVEARKKLAPELEKIGITEADIENLLTGSFSLVGGSNASVMGQKMPGVYLAVEGQKGAAAKFLKLLLENENFSHAVPVTPVKVNGWDTLVQVDPTLVPATLLLGSKGDVLFFGAINPTDMAKKPSLPKGVAELAKEKLIGYGFFDIAAMWGVMKREVGNATPQLGLPAGIVSALKDVLEAELVVPFVKIWSPSMEYGFMEFTVADVAPEKRLWPRLIKLGQAVDKADAPATDFGDINALDILLNVKVALEAFADANPGTDLLTQQEAYADIVTFLKTSKGDLYIGMEVPNEDVRDKLSDEAEEYGLVGSSKINVAPKEDEAYDDHEVVWIKIKQ